MDGQMAKSLDAFITGNYGEDQFKDDRFCNVCAYAQDFQDGVATCVCKHSPMFDQDVAVEDFCDWFESDFDPKQDEPQDFDERRDADDR